MTLDIKALAEQAGMVQQANRIREAGMEPIWWSVDEREITRFARAVLEEAAQRCKRERGEPSGYQSNYDEAYAAFKAVEDCVDAIRSLLPSEPK